MFLRLPSSLLALAVLFCSLSWISQDYSKPLLSRKQCMLKIERFVAFAYFWDNLFCIADWKQVGETRTLIFAQPASQICTYRRGPSLCLQQFSCVCLISKGSLKEWESCLFSRVIHTFTAFIPWSFYTSLTLSFVRLKESKQDSIFPTQCPETGQYLTHKNTTHTSENNDIAAKVLKINKKPFQWRNHEVVSEFNYMDTHNLVNWSAGSTETFEHCSKLS